MDAKEVVKRMKDFGLKGVRDGSVHLFIKPDLLAEFVQSEILAEREACAKLCAEMADDVRREGVTSNALGFMVQDYEECAAAIRSRSNAALRGAEPASSAERPLEGTVRGE